MAQSPDCPHCGLKMTLALPPGGNGSRTYKCYDCDPTDPLMLPDVKGWLSGELAQSAEKFPKK